MTILLIQPAMVPLRYVLCIFMYFILRRVLILLERQCALYLATSERTVKLSVNIVDIDFDIVFRTRMSLLKELVLII